MIAPLEQTRKVEHKLSRPSFSVITAVVLTPLFALVFHWCFIGLPVAAKMAMWPLSLGLSLVVSSFITYRWQQTLRWDFLIMGQLIALLGAIILFASSLM